MRCKACFTGFFAVNALHINELVWSDPNSDVENKLSISRSIFFHNKLSPSFLKITLGYVENLDHVWVFDQLY